MNGNHTKNEKTTMKLKEIHLQKKKLYFKSVFMTRDLELNNLFFVFFFFNNSIDCAAK